MTHRAGNLAAVGCIARLSCGIPRIKIIEVERSNCILLVTFVGVVQAVHVHTDNSKLPSHECSICSVAHSGILTSAVYRPVPVLVRSVLMLSPEAIGNSFGVIFSLRIRPPPTL
jgi:hypothetical protein